MSTHLILVWKQVVLATVAILLKDTDCFPKEMYT